MEYLTPKLLEAFEFSALAHQNQFRKGSEKIPYFSHPALVALILSKAAFSENVVIAGVLHDVVEDTDHTVDEIGKQFGTRVVELVLGVTEERNLPWKERKHSYNEKIKKSDSEIKALSAADMIANRQSRLKLLRQGINIWKYFDNTPGYEKRAMENDIERLAAIKFGFDHPMISELEALLEESVRLTNALINKDNFS